MDLDLRIVADEKAEPPSKMAHVLLTGATGFLGAVILKTLLLNSESVHVHCIIRSKDGVGAEERLKASLPWWPEMKESHRQRVHVLALTLFISLFSSSSLYSSFSLSSDRNTAISSFARFLT